MALENTARRGCLGRSLANTEFEPQGVHEANDRAKVRIPLFEKETIEVLATPNRLRCELWNIRLGLQTLLECHREALGGTFV
jgi:hypothetical protein